MGYLNPALNNSAQEYFFVWVKTVSYDLTRLNPLSLNIHIQILQANLPFPLRSS